MAVHYTNELVDGVRVAVATHDGQKLYCYQKKVTLANGAIATNHFFLSHSPKEISSSDCKPVELPYGTKLEVKGKQVVMRK